MKKELEGFWNSTTAALPVERRMRFSTGKRAGELTVSIHPDMPVPDAAVMSESMTEAAVVEAVSLKDGELIAPQLIFGTVRKSTHDGSMIILTASGRELPVVQLAHALEGAADKMDYVAQMRQADAALGPAQIAEEDHAVGFLYRTDVIHFYPLLSVTLHGDIDSYREGAGTTNDVIPLLPFQN